VTFEHGKRMRAGNGTRCYAQVIAPIGLPLGACNQPNGLPFSLCGKEVVACQARNSRDFDIIACSVLRISLRM